MSAVADHWHDLVTAALLGTDRRQPPEPPLGPLADVVADTAAPTPSARMLAAVAACTAVRRAGLRPRPAAPPLAAPGRDERSMVGAPAARRWRTVVAEWPVLEDEWLATVERRHLRLPPDVLVGLLRRHRGDLGRRARVARLGGPLVPWLVELQPDLAAPGGRGAPTIPHDDLPPLPVPPALLPLLSAPADQVVPSMVGALRNGTFVGAHRAVLVNFVARMRPDVCCPLAAALRDAAPDCTAVALVHVLADLADTRHAMLTELL